MYYQKQSQKAIDVPRSEALEPRQTSENKGDGRVPFVMTYDPSHSSIASTIRKYLPILHSSKRCKLAISEPPMVAFRRPRNIKDTIVRSAMKPAPNQIQSRGFKPCNNCAACKHKHDASVTQHTVASQDFVSFVTGQRFTINHPLNCQSTNVVYVITCKKCGTQYVGETKRALKTRLLEHCGDTKHNRDRPVARHFNKPNHTCDDIMIMAIDRPSSTNYFHRLALESKWIDKLQTSAPLGMNVKGHR